MCKFQAISQKAFTFLKKCCIINNKSDVWSESEVFWRWWENWHALITATTIIV